MDEIKPIKIEEGMKVSELVANMKDAGFGARKIYEAGRIMKKMFGDKDCNVFLGVAGAMVPAGMKQIIIDLLDSGRIKILVTTGANLTHDLIEALGGKHYQCDESSDDKTLNDEGFDRIYNVLMKNEVYGKLEDFFDGNWESISGAKTITEFLWKIGEILSAKVPRPTPPNPHSTLTTPTPEKNKENTSILQKCYEKKIPIFCPAIADSGIGLMVWGRKVSGKKINIDVFEDMNEIIDFSWTSKKNGVIYIGGGVPKNFIQQSLQFSKGASYGIQITTDRAEPGGSSGALLKEGISWGKMEKDAEFVDVFCDATIALPLIWGAVKKDLSLNKI